MKALLLPLGLMAASGFAGLGYQIVWTQQASIWLGHEAAAVLAVVAAFFGGLAAGALALGSRIEASPRPGRWYAACEVLIGLWSVALAFLMAPAGAALLALIGEQPSALWQWSVSFLGIFVLLLPATMAMGATLPAMQRILPAIPALYAANTFGAVVGVLGSAFWLVPQLGLVRTAMVCAGLNLICAAVAFSFFKESFSDDRKSTANFSWILAVTGLLGIGYEVIVVRALSQLTENTVYTFAMLLAVYLVSTALGAAAYQRWRPAGDRLLWWVSVACLLGAATLWGAPSLQSLVLPFLGGLGAEAVLAAAAFALPAFAMGALFSHLCTTSGLGFARALGANTLGAAAAPLVFGVLLLPAFGARLALLLVAAGYLLLSSKRAWAGFLAPVILVPALVFVDVPRGGQLVSYREGVTATVSVVQDADGVRTLRIDNREQEGSSATRFSDSRQALLPLALHPSPRRALFLGVGTGITASAAAAQVEVDAVELVPEVIEASTLFRQGGPSPHLIASDARRFVRATANRYDVIVSDNFHPARSGSGALYTVEHFRAVRERLAPGGLFCQWLPLHQLDLDTLRSIVRSFMEANPGGWAMLATNSLETPILGLVASQENIFQYRNVKSEKPFDVFGNFIAGPASLKRFSAGAPLNTDDRPIVAYRAPRFTYAPDSRPRDRLLALLHEVHITPAELVAADPGWSARLAAYWSARDRFLEAGRDVRPSTDVKRMLAQVREPLLAVLQISPEFCPAYDPLVRMAAALESFDAPAARALLAELPSPAPCRARTRPAP